MKQPVGIGFSAIAAGNSHNCGLAPEGQIYCWGASLGNGTGATQLAPLPVPQPAGVRFTAITAGMDFTCALADDGRAFCWGENDRGQLGDGTFTNRGEPVEVKAPAGIRFSAIAAGGKHACALVKPSGQPACWGGGGLGDGTNHLSTTPVSVGQ